MQRRQICWLAGLLYVLAAGPVGTPLLGWTTQYSLTPSNPGASGQPVMRFDTTGKLHVVYSAPINGTLQLQHRVLNGATWSTAVDLPGPGHKETSPSMVIDSSNNLHVVGIYRVDGTTNTAYSVYYWTYNGVGWTGPTAISSTSGDDSSSRSSPSIAIDKNGTLHVVYSENGHSGGQGDIMYTRHPSGGSWSTAVDITNNGTCKSYGSVSCNIVADKIGNNLHVVWHDDSDCDGFKVWYSKNTNLGLNAWPGSGSWTLISYPDPNAEDYGKSPIIYLDASDNPHVFWIDKLGGSTNVQAYRRYNGTSWTAIENWAPYADTIQDIAFGSGGIMNIVYTDDSSGVRQVYYRQYNFSTFTAPEVIDSPTNLYAADFASIGLDSYGIAHVTWEERQGAFPGTGYIFYSARGQYTGPTGTVAGTVKDQFGAGIANASVSGPTGFSTLSGAGGAYSLIAPTGTNSYSATKDYYTGQTVNNVVVVQNQTTTVNFTITANPPMSPTNFVVTPGNTSNHLTWTQSTSGNQTGTTIRFRTDHFPAAATDGTQVTEVSGTGGKSFDHNNLTNGVKYYYGAFAHDGDGHYGSAATASGSPAVICDYDRDGDVDISDFGHVQACLSGPNVPQSDPGCANAFLDGDVDVDDDDLTVFFNCFAGPGNYANPTCAQ